VFGGGAFGTAIAAVLARKGNIVKILMRLDEIDHVNSINQRNINTMCFPDFVLPSNISATVSPKEALENVSWIIHAVPVQFSYNFLKEIKDEIPLRVPIICVSKGIWIKTLEFMNEIIPKALERQHPASFLCGHLLRTGYCNKTQLQ